MLNNILRKSYYPIQKITLSYRNYRCDIKIKSILDSE